ncbi:MAG: 4-hydroxybenzoate octaprenyltransferase [Sphingomonadales bacterium]
MSNDKAILDAKKGNWVDRYSPASIRPFLKLGRMDRPIGIWLLLWPATWAITMAGSFASYPDLKILGLFLLGAFVMRSAGCAFNDIVDRDYDSKVARTRNRPIAGKEISVQNAWLFLATLALTGLIILLQFNYLTVALGIGSLVFVGIYPFMKRVTYWPQAFLGLTFNWGALLGWAAVTGALSIEALFLYLAGIFWTLGYDTIYAHMDKTDDILVGVKSTALKFGENTRAWLFVFYGLSLGFFFLAGYQNGLGSIYYIGLAFVFFHFHTQISTLDIHSPEACLKTFKSNNLVGLGMFLAIWASKVT